MTHRVVHLVHAMERRVRLRAPALADRRAACERVAEALVADPAYDVVTIRPRTGSVIVERFEGGLDPGALRARVEQLVRAERDDAGRPLSAWHPERHPGPTRVAGAVARAFAGINADVRMALDGRADLGTLLPVVFATAGFMEIAATGKLPAPAWFNLLWWSVRSFMTFNVGAIQEQVHANGGSGSPPVEEQVAALRRDAGAKAA